MKINEVANPWPQSRAWAVAWRTAGWLAVGVAGCLWLSLVIPIPAVLGITLVAGGAHYLHNARAEGRWRAALDRYIEEQLSGGTRPRRDAWR